MFYKHDDESCRPIPAIRFAPATGRHEPEAPSDGDITLDDRRSLAALDRDLGFTENKGFFPPI